MRACSTRGGPSTTQTRRLAERRERRRREAEQEGGREREEGGAGEYINCYRTLHPARGSRGEPVCGHVVTWRRSV
eukprot:3562542-Rhodomonas_salina.1